MIDCLDSFKNELIVVSRLSIMTMRCSLSNKTIHENLIVLFKKNPHMIHFLEHNDEDFPLRWMFILFENGHTHPIDQIT